MSIVRVLAGSLCGGVGLLLAATTTFAPDDITIVPQAGTGAGEPAACIDAPACIDRYLWSVYQRAPKAFAWKDVQAAERIGMSPMDYVIGGMDPGFRITLYRALRTLDIAGFMPGILCGFRDDYRQSITTGTVRAQNDRSFHGGSMRGGYGHGMAADIVSVSVREGDSARMWAWIDEHEADLGVGRPYLSRDPAHVAPLDGEEYFIYRIASARSRGRLPLTTPRGQGPARRSGTANRSRNTRRFGYAPPAPSP